MKLPICNSRARRTFSLIAIVAFLITVVCLTLWLFWPARGDPSIRVVFSHFENVPGGTVAVFQVSNIGRRSVTMYGPRGVWPEWLIGSYNGTNWDLDSSPGFDFSQTKPIALRPGTNITMPTLLPHRNSWIVGVQYSTVPYVQFLPSSVWRVPAAETFFRTRMRIAWSDAINRSSKPSNVVAPLGVMTNQIRINSP